MQDKILPHDRNVIGAEGYFVDETRWGGRGRLKNPNVLRGVETEGLIGNRSARIVGQVESLRVETERKGIIRGQDFDLLDAEDARTGRLVLSRGRNAKRQTYE